MVVVVVVVVRLNSLQPENVSQQRKTLSSESLDYFSFA